MANHWLNAYVLHRRPYRETSVIAELFTREHGRVSVVYRGVKSSKGKNFIEIEDLKQGVYHVTVTVDALTFQSRFMKLH